MANNAGHGWLLGGGHGTEKRLIGAGRLLAIPAASIIQQVDHDRREGFAIGPDHMIDPSGPDYRVTRAHDARLALRSTEAQQAAARDHQEQDVVGGAMLVQPRLRLSGHRRYH